MRLVQRSGTSTAAAVQQQQRDWKSAGQLTGVDLEGKL